MNYPTQEKTLVVIKPDGVQRSLIGEVVKRYERAGLKLVAMKFLIPSEDMVKAHYLVDPEWPRKVGEKSMAAYEKMGEKFPFENALACGDEVLNRLVRYMSSGPVVAMVWQGNQSVGIVRKITGGTEPLTSDVGTIRGDFTIDSYSAADPTGRAVRNIIHASGKVDEANKEIPIWFKEEEIVKYNLVQEKILYDVNLDGIIE